jgi:uncharacterized protein (TIGR02597 family)
VSPALFAQEIVTIPVVFMQNSVTPASGPSNPASSVISAPVYKTPAFISKVSSVDGATALTVASGNFSVNQFSASPYFVRLKSGPSTGRFFRITANTESQLTIDGLGYSITSSTPASSSETQVSVGDRCEIFAANTLGTLFGVSGVPFQTGASANSADNVYLWNGTAWDIFFNNGSHWRKSGNGLNQDNAIVFPDSGLFIVRRGTGSLTLRFSGTISSTTERTDILGPGSTFKGNRF